MKTWDNVCDVIKENITPTSSPHIKQGIHKKLQMCAAGSNDPLQFYLPYIKQVNLKPQNLIFLLETIEFFKNNPQYVNDKRYIQLWLIFSKNHRSPWSIFKQMLLEDIGTLQAMTYEAIGLFCESNNDFLKAEYYYRMGIDKKVNDYGILIDRLNNLGNQVSLAQSPINFCPNLCQISLTQTDHVFPQSALVTPAKAQIYIDQSPYTLPNEHLKQLDGRRPLSQLYLGS